MNCRDRGAGAGVAGRDRQDREGDRGMNMRGDQELKCLNIIKEAIFCKDGHPMENPFTHKTYLDVSNDEFKKKKIWFVNSDCYNSYFGLLESDRKEFEYIVFSSKPNSNLSLFPDFVFDNGFIEHFQITSSKTNRKGSVHKKEESAFVSKVKSETEKIKQEWNETPSFDEVCSKSWVHTNPVHTYEFLVDSFKNNWEHHLESCKKYTGSKEVGIFMIEYSEVALSMYENVYHDWINGMSKGDMRGQEKFHCYRLSRDKQLLNYIYQFRDNIKYVIFINCERFEVIRLENIPYLLKLMPWDYLIVPMCVNNVASLHNITIPGVNEKGEKNE